MSSYSVSNLPEITRNKLYAISIFLIVFAIIFLFFPLSSYTSGVCGQATEGQSGATCDTCCLNGGALIGLILLVIFLIIGVYLYAKYDEIYKITKKLATSAQGNPAAYGAAVGIVDPEAGAPYAQAAKTSPASGSSFSSQALTGAKSLASNPQAQEFIQNFVKQYGPEALEFLQANPELLEL